MGVFKWGKRICEEGKVGWRKFVGECIERGFVLVCMFFFILGDLRIDSW